jgi:DNA-directed RNA polymerase specialized sigma24 family protein
MFERMVNEHQHRVFALSLALTGNRHDAEEVAQDTFLKAYRALCNYPPDRIRDLKQKAWLHRIALNVVRNRVRRVRPRLVELNGSEPDHGCSAPCPGALLRGGSRRSRTTGWNCEIKCPSRTQIAQRR